MCNKSNYNDIMKELAEMKAMQNEIAAAVKDLEEEIKTYMQESGQEELQGTEHKATYKEVTSSKVDTKLVKMDFPEVADKCMKTTTTMRFNFR